ncbi:MAG: bifunctional DNA primase/polymerase [Actinomycetota bacterium]
MTARNDAPAARYQTALQAAATRYANAGLHVFPLRPGTKRPAVPNHRAEDCDHSDPRCADGHAGWEARATTDTDRITRAWTAKPWGIGIACGPSGLLVVDLDTPTEDGGPAGVDVYSRIAREAGATKLPTTFVVATPSGGRHLYYRRPAGVELGNSCASLGERIDTRANGGYVVAPPTRITAGSYRATTSAPIAEAPDWLIEALTPRPRPAANSDARPALGGGAGAIDRYVAAAVDGETHRVRTARQPKRLSSLYSAAVSLGELVGAGVLTQERAEAVLHDCTPVHIANGAYTQRDATSAITNGIRKGITQPRQLPTTTTAETRHRGAA